MSSAKKAVNTVRNTYDCDAEVVNLRSFCSSNDLYLPENFYNGIKPNDIIEIYSFPDHKQIYANSEFLKLSSYSLEQMISKPFHELFWRSDEAHLALMNRAIQTAKYSTAVEPWALDNHELIENLHPRKRTFEMKMGLISPCFRTIDDARVAWASTLQVEFVYEWPEDVT